MKYSFNILKLILFSFSIFHYELFSQILSERKYDPNEIILSALEVAAHAKYGSDFEVNYHIMDSLIANSKRGKITDPYNTLRGTILFSAWSKSQEDKDIMDSVVTGIYKNGQIIWDDFPGTKAGFGGALSLTKDINNDGEVDILQAETDFTLRTREGGNVRIFV